MTNPCTLQRRENREIRDLVQHIHQLKFPELAVVRYIVDEFNRDRQLPIELVVVPNDDDIRCTCWLRIYLNHEATARYTEHFLGKF